MTAKRLGFHVVTIFPEMIQGALKQGVVAQAVKEGAIEVTCTSPRQFTSNNHQTVDDRPFGGGDGMIMIAEPLALAIEAIQSRLARKAHVIHFSPRGRRFTDQVARELADSDDLILIASRYGGVDQRFLNTFVDDEISIGDFVVSGGELPALLLIDAVARLLPGVLGNESSAGNESFSPALRGLEYPQYTRPRSWREQDVPEALLSGDHARIEEWKAGLACLVTFDRRPDLIGTFTKCDFQQALAALRSLSESDLACCGLRDRQRLEAELKERFGG